jgi:hypothetical protein
MPLDKAPEPKWVVDPQGHWDDFVPPPSGHWECPEGYVLYYSTFTGSNANGQYVTTGEPMCSGITVGRNTIKGPEL